MATPGPGCGMWELKSLLWWHVNSVVACGVSFPDQGLNPVPMSLSRWTTREVSHFSFFNVYKFFMLLISTFKR